MPHRSLVRLLMSRVGAVHERFAAGYRAACGAEVVGCAVALQLAGDRAIATSGRSRDLRVTVAGRFHVRDLVAFGGEPGADTLGTFAISIEDGLTEQVNSTSAVAKTFVIAIEGSLSEQVTGTSAVVKKLVVALPDALTEQVTSTSAVAKKLVIAMEDAVTDEITATTTVANKITVSGIEMADRFVRLEHDVLRGLIQGAARPLAVQNGTKYRAAK